MSLPVEHSPLDHLPVDLWICNLDRAAQLADQHVYFISPAEREKAQRFAFAPLQTFYILSRSLTRYILGAQIGVPPKDIEFSYEERGKPYLSAYPELFFNVSHSGSLLACAVSRLAPIGIDIELVRPMPDAPSVAERFFSKAETARLLSLPSEAQTVAFFECWTRKEAFLKATGDGLSHDLTSFTVRFGAGETPMFEQILAPADDPAAWTLRSFAPSEGYLGALAVRAEIGELRIYEVSPI